MKVAILYSAKTYTPLCPSVIVRSKKGWYSIPLRAETVEAKDLESALSLAKPKPGEVVLNTIKVKKEWRISKGR